MLSKLPALSEGISSIDLSGKPLTKRDQDAFIGMLQVTLGGWTAEDAMKAGLLWDHIEDKGWSHERLQSTLYVFFEKAKVFGKVWYAADFFECAPENDLHDNTWYLDLSESDRARCEIFRAPDNKCLYRFQGTGVGLPKEFVRVWP
ncbi:MAG: hypothetical protein ACHQNE_07460 [Candidatus Kapaibacterium sp.]